MSCLSGWNKLMNRNKELPNWLYGAGAVAGTIVCFIAAVTFVRFSNPVTPYIVIVFNQYGNPTYRSLQQIVDYAFPQLPVYLMTFVNSIAAIVAWKRPLAGGVIIFIGLLSMMLLPVINSFYLWGRSEPLIAAFLFLPTIISGIFFILSGSAGRNLKRLHLNS